MAGERLVDGRFVVRGEGLEPGSTALVVVHSTGLLLGRFLIGPTGVLAATVVPPARLTVGVHHVEVTGLNAHGRRVQAAAAFLVAPGSRFGWSGRRWLGEDAGLLAVLAAIGAGGTRRRKTRVGWLEDVELEREEDSVSGSGRGDRSGTWRWPGTAALDRASRTWPVSAARVSPVAGRVLSDGDYVRAMIGSAWSLLALGSVAVAALAGSGQHWRAGVPSLGYLAALLALSVLDATLGAMAATVLVGGALLSGHVTSAPQVREMLGVGLLLFAVPLAAGSLRALRRNVTSWSSARERIVDVALVGLFTAWAATKLAAVLPALSGRDLAVARQLGVVAGVAAGSVVVRVGLETLCAHLYHRRLAQVRAESELESSSLQVSVSLAVQAATYVFVSEPFAPGWALALGTAVLFAPLLPWVFADRLREHEWATRWLARGVVKWVLVILGGLAVAAAVSALGEPSANDWGFVLAPLPVVAVWSLEPFAGEGPTRRIDAARVVGGAALVGAAIVTVLAFGVGA